MAKAKKLLEAIDWAAIDDCLPTAQDPDTREKRDKIFRSMDSSGNKVLSQTEVQGGLSGLFDKELLNDKGITDLKPAINCAFKCARNLAPMKKKQSRRGAVDNNIDPREFHALLVAFRQYLELSVLFKGLDKDQSGKLNLQEVKGETCLELLDDWGITKKQVHDKFPDKWEDAMDFEDFADWCVSSHFKGGMDLKLDDSDNEEVIVAEGADDIKEKIGYQDENKAYGAELTKSQNEAKVAQAFNDFDTDRNGVISKEELKAVLKDVTELKDDEIDTMFTAIDVNKDGLIQREEFVAWLFSENEVDIKGKRA